MESDWITQLPPLLHDSATISVQNNSQGVDAYKRNPYSRPCSLQTRLHLRVLEGPKVLLQVVVVLRSRYAFCMLNKFYNTISNFMKNWSSAESFLSSSSTNFASSLEQCRSLNAQLNEIKLENAELIKNNRILSAKLDTLACVFDNLFDFLARS